MAHMLARRPGLCLTVVTLVVTLLVGCIGDPVRKVRQGIRLEVSDSHGLPAPGVKVKTMESWESWQTRLEGMPESKQADAPEMWRNQPWLEGITDAEGNVDIVSEGMEIGWTKGRKPPAKLDSYSNREYNIKVEDQTNQEELRVLMKPGELVKGKWFTVRVKLLETPKYVSGW